MFIRTGSENIQNILETVVKNNNSTLLKDYLKENEFNVVDGVLMHVKEKIQIYRFAAEHCALKCIVIFMDLGVQMYDEEKDEVMKAAIQEDNMVLIQKVLELKNDIGVFENFLKHAAAFGNRNAFAEIVRKYNDLQVQPNNERETDTLDGKSCVTVEMQSFQTPRKQSKFDIGRFYQNNNSCLHVAAKNPSNSSIELMELIIENFPDLLESQNDKGRTPLHEAAQGLYLEILNFNLQLHLFQIS